jgi:hypothetical protein
MTTTDEMAQLVSLWTLISEVQLTDRKDAITCRWTRHGEYSSKSAYTAQFSGSFCTFDSGDLESSDRRKTQTLCLVIGAA